MTTAVTDLPCAPSSPSQRWVSVASLDAAALAGADAGRRLLAEAVGDRDPALLLLFAGIDVDSARIATQISAAVPAGVPLVGCTTAGEIATAGPADGSAVLMALGGSGMRATARIATGASSGLRDAGAAVAGAVDDLRASAHRVFMLLADGLVGDLQEVVRGAYSVCGAQVPMVGGCAGDGGRMQRTFVVYGDRVVTDAVVGVAVGSPAPFGIGVRHGWRRVGEAMLVTASEGSRVLTLDDQPALDVFLERVGAPLAARHDPAAFTDFAMCHPLGVSRRSGEEVRFIAGADFAQRSLQCIAQVPQGGLAWIMEGDESSVLSATDAACADALAGLGGTQPAGLVAFDCIARRGVLGSGGIGDEVRRIAAAAPGAPVAGFYTYGEIARTHGTGGFHNQTLVVLAIG